MQLLDLSVASAGVAAIAIVSSGNGMVRLVAAPELAGLSQVELIKLMVDGATALLSAAEGMSGKPGTTKAGRGQ